MCEIQHILSLRLKWSAFADLFIILINYMCNKCRVEFIQSRSMCLLSRLFLIIIPVSVSINLLLTICASKRTNTPITPQSHTINHHNLEFILKTLNYTKCCLCTYGCLWLFVSFVCWWEFSGAPRVTHGKCSPVRNCSPVRQLARNSIYETIKTPKISAGLDLSFY